MSSIASRRVSEFCNLFVSVVKRILTGCEAFKFTVFILQRNSSNSIKQCITHAQTMYYKKTLRLMIGCLFVENEKMLCADILLNIQSQNYYYVDINVFHGIRVKLYSYAHCIKDTRV